MLDAFHPKLEILPATQRLLWDELGSTPRDFVLYGGTALALRLGHRVSEDFDFFSSQSFGADALMRRIPYLKGARVDQFQPDTLTCSVDRGGGEVKISYFGGLDNLMRVADPDPAPGTGLAVASLIDVAAMKFRVVQMRAAYKDYVDIVALLDAGIDVGMGLAASQAVYGSAFNPMVTMKALSFFGDGDLARLDPARRERLLAAVSRVDLTKLPVFTGRVGLAKEDT